MKFYKILNLLNMFGQADYKGLDIDQFIAGGQVYYTNEQNTTEALIATNENFNGVHPDLIELTESQYIDIKNQINAERKNKSQSFEQRISDIEIAIASILGGAE